MLIVSRKARCLRRSIPRCSVLLWHNGWMVGARHSNFKKQINTAQFQGSSSQSSSHTHCTSTVLPVFIRYPPLTLLRILLNSKKGGGNNRTPVNFFNKRTFAF